MQQQFIVVVNVLHVDGDALKGNGDAFNYNEELKVLSVRRRGV